MSRSFAERMKANREVDAMIAAQKKCVREFEKQYNPRQFKGMQKRAGHSVTNRNSMSIEHYNKPR